MAIEYFRPRYGGRVSGQDRVRRRRAADDRVTVVAWWICYAFFRSKTEALPATKDLADAELEGSELRTSVTRWL